MAVTIKDVARESGVSISTVSHALSGNRPVSPGTRQRVLEVAERLGYRPNRMAASMVTGKTRTIGVVVPDLANPFFAELIRAAEAEAGAHGYLTIVGSSERNESLEERYLEILFGKQVDALLFATASERPTQQLNEICRHGTPVVVVDQSSSVDLPLASLVTVDNRAGGALAAEHLVGLGHTEIGVILGPAHLPTVLDRLDGFRKVLRRHRLRLPKERMEHCDYFTMEAGLAATERLLSRDRAVTALFCSNDMIALGAIKAVTDAGATVPRDVSVIGFDDIFISALMTPALTTVRQPIARIGEEAVALAISLTQDPSQAPVQRILPVELVVRASTAPAPTRR